MGDDMMMIIMMMNMMMMVAMVTSGSPRCYAMESLYYSSPRRANEDGS